MYKITRSEKNPILTPVENSLWESEASFNGSVVRDGDICHMVYRAQSIPQQYAGVQLSLSTIGYANSLDGMEFGQRRQLILPEKEWEKFGCEDPRITKFGDTYYIFYTALSGFPFGPENIRVGMAMSRDLRKIDQKHPVTVFNSKAMALFPQTIGGKMAAILTVNTDLPPAKIGIAFFNTPEEIWNPDYWRQWYSLTDKFTLPLLRSPEDHVEVGAPPLLTEKGWLLVYSYIYNYRTSRKNFTIEAAILDVNNPLKILGRSGPLMTADEDYESYGNIPDIVFPSGAVIEENNLRIYYGAADTSVCAANMDLNELLEGIIKNEPLKLKEDPRTIILRRFAGNPILSPLPENDFENKYAFNPAAIYEEGKVHLLYRAVGPDDTSVLGYARSSDGMHIDYRYLRAVYSPREPFEIKARPGSSGCEDPRLTRIGDRIYLCYTAFNGIDAPRVALSSIRHEDFLKNNWRWERPILISPPGVDDKDACIFPEKIGGKFVFIHRFNPHIWIDFTDDLHFRDRFLQGVVLLKPQIHSWDSEKIGLGPPPVRTESGWLLIYHGLSRYSKKYRLGAALLDLEVPAKVLARLPYPILEPAEPNEKTGYRPDTVFSNGAVVIGDTLYVYYGAGDRVTDVATVGFTRLVEELRRYRV